MRSTAAKDDGKSSSLENLGIVNTKTTPPIGVFWDIENCQVPKNKSAFDVVQHVRSRYFYGHREAEFLCVCDVNKESKDVIKELNDAQVVVVHIDSLCKNAADIKLRQCMLKFADIHGPPATVVLISGDVNFAPDLSDLRYRREFTIIVIHNGMANVALLACAHHSISLSELTFSIPNRSLNKKQTPKNLCKLIVSNIPTTYDLKLITQRLEHLSDNCGGKVTMIKGNEAILKFSSPESTRRAKKRMDNENVFGNQISVNFPCGTELSKKNSTTLNKDRNYHLPSSIVHQQPRSRSNPLPNHSDGTSSFVGNKTTSSNIKTMLDPFHHDRPNGVGSKIDNCTDHSSIWNCDIKRNEPFTYTWGKETNSKSNGCALGDGVRRAKGLDTIQSVNDTSKEAASFNRSWMTNSSCRRNTPSPQFDFNGHLLNGSSNGIASSDGSSTVSSEPEQVELQVSNLDPNIDMKHLKQHLLALFLEHVRVLHMFITVNTDGNIFALIKVPSMNDAQYAISKLHRTRLGSKRISISISSNVETIPLNVLRSEVVALLLDVPGKRLALFKFRELYEKRYHRSIGISELHRLRDAISIQENANGKTVVLNSDFKRNTPSPACSDGSKEVQEILEMARCDLHIREDDGKGWAEKEQATQLPSVMVALKTLVTNVHSLLQLHGNGIPLNSFPTCYQCVFGNFEIVDTGVPLEHLVTVVPGVHIMRNSNGAKVLDWVNEKSSEYTAEFRNVSPPLASQLSLLCREIVDLLKNQSQCRIPFTKFIPAYHHHFGRQCRVADYGFTRLLDLLDAIPHVVQILGDGNKRILTLTHRAQVKRFNADLLRILKSQVSKEILLKDFADAYAKCIGKDFNIVNYGVCDILDMLGEMAEGIILITGSGSDLKIQLPKREQSQEEAERTKQFKVEAMELLRNSPRCRMGFTKFIPSYHHHFSKQCRVADYGFTKLIELFEAIPDVVEVKPGDEDGEDRILQLAQSQLMDVFADQITSLMRVPGRQMMALEKLMRAYVQQNGYSIYPEDYNASDIVELLQNVKTIKVTEAPGGILVALNERHQNVHLSLCVKKILLNEHNGKMAMPEFLELLEKEYGHECDMQHVIDDVGKLVTVENYGLKKIVKIDPQQLLRKDVVQLLQNKGGRILLSNFDEAFNDRYKRPCVPAQFGFSSLAALLQSIQDVVVFKGRSTKRAIVLNSENANLLNLYGEQHILMTKTESEKSKRALSVPEMPTATSKTQIVDLMNDPIPNRIPSPALRPQPVSQTEQLIRFDSPVTDELCSQNGFENQRSMNGHEALSLISLTNNDHESLFTSSFSTTSLFQHFYPPTSSLLPSVPLSWKMQTVPASPPQHCLSSICHENSPGTPTTNDGTDMMVMNTPPCIRELIANSSPETTPTKTMSSNRSLSRIAAQFPSLSGSSLYQ